MMRQKRNGTALADIPWITWPAHALHIGALTYPINGLTLNEATSFARLRSFSNDDQFYKLIRGWHTLGIIGETSRASISGNAPLNRGQRLEHNATLHSN